MKIANDEKRMEIIIDSYEFPYHETNHDADNNWLNVKVICEDEVLVEEGIDSCLSTQELVDMRNGLSKALLDVPYESDFMEPSLYIKALPHEDVVDMMISFHLPNRYVFAVFTTISKQELDAMVSELSSLCKAFPIRKKKRLN